MAAGNRARVVVGVHDSITGLEALRFAVAHARRIGVPVTAVRAWRFSPPWPDDAATRPWRSEIIAEADQHVRSAFAAAMGAMPTDIPVRVLLLETAAGKALVEYADQEDDLLVVGGGRRGRRFAGIAGPVTRYCLRHARCPVVVVPPPELAQVASVRQLRREVARDLRRLA